MEAKVLNANKNLTVNRLCMCVILFGRVQLHKHETQVKMFKTGKFLSRSTNGAVCTTARAAGGRLVARCRQTTPTVHPVSLCPARHPYIHTAHHLQSWIAFRFFLLFFQLQLWSWPSVFYYFKFSFVKDCLEKAKLSFLTPSISQHFSL